MGEETEKQSGEERQQGKTAEMKGQRKCRREKIEKGMVRDADYLEVKESWARLLTVKQQRMTYQTYTVN